MSSVYQDIIGFGSESWPFHADESWLIAKTRYNIICRVDKLPALSTVEYYMCMFWFVAGKTTASLYYSAHARPGERMASEASTKA